MKISSQMRRWLLLVLKNRNSKKSATIFFSGVSIMPGTEKTMDVYFSNLCFWTQNNHLLIWGYLLIEEISSVPKITKMGVGQNKKYFSSPLHIIAMKSRFLRHAGVFFTSKTWTLFLGHCFWRKIEKALEWELFKPIFRYFPDKIFFLDKKIKKFSKFYTKAIVFTFFLMRNSEVVWILRNGAGSGHFPPRLIRCRNRCFKCT